MSRPSDYYEQSIGLWYAVVGVILFAIGGYLLTQANETELAVVIAYACFGAAIYLFGVGAVARALQFARIADARRRGTDPR